MSYCRHGNQQGRCAQCTREMAPAHEALKSALKYPTHLCSLEIDPCDPSAIIQNLTDEVELLRTERDNLRYQLQTLLHAYRTGNSISTIRESEMREAAGLPK